MRKKILLVAGALVLITALIVLIKFLNTGRLIVRTESSNTISIINSDKNNETILEQQGDIQVRLPKGKYLISVAGRSVSSTQTVQLPRLKTIELIINPTDTNTVETVINRDTTGITANSSTLRFLDSSQSVLYQISGKNELLPIKFAPRLVSIKWLDPNFGIGSALDGNIFVVGDKSAEKLPLPETININDGRTEYSLKNNSELYISDGKKLFIGKIGGSYRKIYESDINIVALRSNENRIVVLEKDDIEEGNSELSTFKIIENDGKVRGGEHPINDLAISPSGNWLSLNLGDTIQIIDEQMRPKDTLFADSTSQMQWQDESMLIYSKNDQLWSYDLAKKKAALIANAPLGGLILELYTPKNASHIYFSVQDDNRTSLKRVGTHGQKTPATLINLQSVLPLTLAGCYVDIINFNSFGVILKHDNPTNEECVNKAKQELSERGFDISNLSFSLE